MRPLIAGNWKKHGMAPPLGEIEAVAASVQATPEEIIEVHAHIRECLGARLDAQGKKVRILYGGSVKSADARAILALPEVGGVLVGAPA